VSSTRRQVLGLVARWTFLVVALVLAVMALAERWHAVRSSLGNLGAPALVVAVVAAAAAVASSGEQQRSLLASTGVAIPPREWGGVFYVAQLGKYVPGTAWAYVAQMEMARRHGVRRAASVQVIILGAAMTVLSAMVVAIPAVATTRWDAVPLWIQWVLVGGAAASLVVFVSRPGVATALTARASSRWPRLEAPLIVHGAQARAAVLWSIVAWLLYGAHLWSIVVPLGMRGAGSAVSALGAFALAWVCGFLFLIAPAGVGVREAVLVALLGPDIGVSAALAAAVASRFLIMVAELILTGIGALLRARRVAATPA
jgi:hypothetical protein